MNPREPHRLELEAITRRSKKCSTIVELHWEGAWKTWITMGEANVVPRGEMGLELGEWSLIAHLPQGVTDREHDSAYALILPIIGTTFRCVEYHRTRLSAWIDPARLEDFHVPPPGYNPLILNESIWCETCEATHLIVPETHYVPPRDPALFSLVAGKRLNINIAVLEAE